MIFQLYNHKRLNIIIVLLISELGEDKRKIETKS